MHYHYNRIREKISSFTYEDSFKNERIKMKGKEGRRFMKGYYVTDGYMGWIDGNYRLFADESDYLEYLEEE